MNTLKKEQLTAIILSSICIVFGVLFCVIPLKTLSAIETIVCIILLVYGIVCILAYCLKNTETRDWVLFLKGIIATAIGLLVMFVGALFVICLGLVVALSGAIYIKTAIDEKKEKDKSWWISLIIGVVLALIGVAVAILYNTNLAKSAIMIVFGIALIVDGIVRLVYTFVIHKQLRSLIVVKKEKKQTIEAEFVVKSADENDNQKTQKDENIDEKSEKNQQKSKDNAENNEFNKEDDSSNEGFV